MSATAAGLLALGALALAGCAAERPASARANAAPPAVTPRGYTSTELNGRTLYCRDEIVTGSLLRTRVCLTPLQLEAEQLDAGATADELRRQRGIDCSGRQGKCAR